MKDILKDLVAKMNDHTDRLAFLEDDLDSAHDKIRELEETLDKFEGSSELNKESSLSDLVEDEELKLKD